MSCQYPQATINILFEEIGKVMNKDINSFYLEDNNDMTLLHHLHKDNTLEHYKITDNYIMYMIENH
jgi:hypothetical protein